jgi:streptogramin lyase
MCYKVVVVHRDARLPWRSALHLCVLAALLTGVTAAAAATGVGRPRVSGPRTTKLERPLYRFRAAHAVSFRCAFDSKRLHACRARFSQRLLPGRHTLRVRAVGKRRALSRVVAVKVTVELAYPQLAAAGPIRVGAGAGVPAAVGGSVWVPLTGTGDLERVDPATGSVTARAHVGSPSPAGSGFLDSAAAADGSIWSASDEGGTVARVDAASGAQTGTIQAGNRPGGLAVGDGAVWAFGFQGPDVTRIDASTGATRTVHVDGASAAGIAYGAGSLWVLSLNPAARILEVDPASGAVRAAITLDPPFSSSHSLIDAWWLAYGDGAVWATLPNYGAVARLDTATHTLRYVHTPYGRPFGVAVGGGSAWVATDHGVLRLDSSTGRPTGAALLPAASRSGFASIAYGDGSAWFTNYDRGTLTGVSG